MSVVKSCISNIYNGNNKSYIYVWFSKKFRFVYVGQTNDRFGTLGRALNHFKKNGTLRERVETKIGQPLEDVYDLELISFSLPQISMFVSIESSYREAVEYLVQIGLRESRINVTPMFSVVSWTRGSDRTNEQINKKLAESIVTNFIDLYNNTV